MYSPILHIPFFLAVNKKSYRFYNKAILQGIISKPYKTQGTTTINAIIIGSNIVQQCDINWLKGILGNEALGPPYYRIT